MKRLKNFILKYPDIKTESLLHFLTSLEEYDQEAWNNALDAASTAEGWPWEKEWFLTYLDEYWELHCNQRRDY